ncbi:MAG TPA: ATP-binding protein [Bacteroidia bacterium]|nr:ATP-binding protein [Bacteroidia bacterium]
MRQSELYHPKKIRIQLGVAVALSLMLVGLLGWFSRKNNADLANALGEQEKGQRVIEKISEFRDSLIVTHDQLLLFNERGEASVLDNLQLSTLHFRQLMKELDGLVTDPSLKPQLDRLHQLADEKIQHDRVIVRMRISGAEVSTADLSESEALTDELFTASKTLEKDHKKLLLSRINESAALSSRITFFDTVAAVLAVLIICMAGILLFRDISKRNKLEKELLAATERVHQSAVLKEQFMANMSHEIRTPLNAVLGFAELLARTNLDDQQKEHLRVIRQSGQNLLHILNDILDFSKLEAGMMRLEEIPFSVQGLMHSISTMFQHRATEKRIKLVFHPIENIPDPLTGDPTRLTQILVNLVGNAIKFTDEGYVEVRTRLLKEENGRLLVQFSVHDTGIGIPSERMNDIFDRFNQGENDTARKYGGTGLGLSIVKRLVELQGGIISVDSVPGKGTTFTFLLPYTRYAAALPAETVSRKEEPGFIPEFFSGISVLVAEDNPLNQRLIGELLSSWKISFDLASTGPEVIGLLRKKTYDLVLMDIQMPGQNGYETTRQIREELKLSLPIVAVTAHAMPGEREKCISSGMNDYLAKPISEREFFHLLRRILSGKPQLLKTVYRKDDGGSERITNLDYLHELANGNEGFVAEMISLFLSENPVELETMERAIDEMDFAMIVKTAHKMRSTIPFVGLSQKLDQPLKNMEVIAASTQNISELKQLFSFVSVTCRKAAAELAAA